jgi:phosphoribosylamine--glycine ligase
LRHLTLRWRPEAAVTVVMAANGYPGSYRKGSPIRALEQAGQVPGTIVFHAGTKAEADGTVTAQGGRVLAVTALGADIAEARSRAYQAVDRIDWPEGFCRRDIAV